MSTTSNNPSSMYCETCVNSQLQKVRTPRWFIAISILLLGIPYLVKRETFMCPKCGRTYFREPERFDWSGRLQAIIIIVILFSILILVEILLNRLFNH